MTELFAVVESELSSMIAFGEQLDPLNSLNMLVVIGQRVAQAQEVHNKQIGLLISAVVACSMDSC